ncbi:MAG: hypothetical protein FWC06_03100 [Treponema sp.]|nr:hypothetical protein [Treponema sp.]
METKKTFRDLLNAVPLADDDVFALHQLGAFNPILQQNGDTRRLTVKELMNYFMLPFYAASSPFLIASDRRKLTIKNGTKIGDVIIRQDIELNVSNTLDTGAITNGKDYYVFISKTTPINFLISLNKTAPNGFTRIGEFHTLCASVGNGLTYEEGGETKNHLLNGYVAGDILPYSVSCLNHRPFSEPEGMAYIPSLDFWSDIYLPSGNGINTKSVYQGAITRSRQYVDFVEDMFCVKKELLDDAEFAAAMLGSNEQTAVAGESASAATTGGAGGRVDTAGRRMISIYGVEEGCGSLWQWLRTTSAAGYGENLIYGQLTSGYGDIFIGTANRGPFLQAGNKGSFYGVVATLRGGGSYTDGSSCGSRARNALYARSGRGGDATGRGRSSALRISL